MIENQLSYVSMCVIVLLLVVLVKLMPSLSPLHISDRKNYVQSKSGYFVHLIALPKRQTNISDYFLIELQIKQFYTDLTTK